MKRFNSDDLDKKLNTNATLSKLTKLDVESKNKPECQYGKSCYRKNPQHFEDFCHPDGSINTSNSSLDANDSSSSSLSSVTSTPLSTDLNISSKAIEKIVSEDLKMDKFVPLMFLTKVMGIDDKFNELAIDIKDILNLSLGTLIMSCQFNYCIDINWLVKQYPLENREKPLLIVHGSSNAEKLNMEKDIQPFPHIKLCNAPLEIAYGTHHTKMMILLYEEGLRVVVTTANLIKEDWYQKTQGVWVSPLFKKMTNLVDNNIQTKSKSTFSDAVITGDSRTNFKSDLIQYLKFYKRHELNEWIELIRVHNMASARVFLIGSTPGRHSGPTKIIFGHLKLKEVLNKHNICKTQTNQWPLIGQFSSVGSLGPSSSTWLTGEFINSLSAGVKVVNQPSGQKISTGLTANPSLQLIFPTVENVRLSLEGYMAGGSIPYSLATSRKQPYFDQYLHQWVARKSGRSLAAPHIKSYFRLSTSHQHISWFLLTSSNLSKAAWGVQEKKKKVPTATLR